MTEESSFGQIQLGRTNLAVPPLGLGTWAWGDRWGWGYGRRYGETDLRAAFRASLELGMAFFDTAEIYGWGRSERFIGRFLRETAAEAAQGAGQPEAGQALARQPEVGQPVVVATKFMPYPWRLRRQSLVAALRASLRRLGLDRVDLYQIHGPLPPIPVETWAARQADAVEAGLTRTVGVSNYNLVQMRRAHDALARRGIPLAANQVEYSLLCRAPERNGLLAACRELGVTLIAYSPLARGLLTGKYTPNHPPPGPYRRVGRRYLAAIQPLIALLWEIGARHGAKTPAQVALNWTLAKGTLPIPGAKNERQARENAGALGWRLTADELAALDAASREL